MKLSAKSLLSRVSRYSGVMITLGLLVAHLSIIGSYGFTWDFHYHFFGGGALLGIRPEILEPRPLPFMEPDPRRAVSLPYGALMSIPPVASYLFFTKTVPILAPDVAYHLPIVLWGILGSVVLFVLLRPTLGTTVAVLGMLFLSLTPRYFGDLHNNMKDIPSSVIFAVNMWAIYRLFTKKRVIDLIFSCVAFAIAFNIKVNSIFIPAIFTALYVLVPRITKKAVPRFFAWYLLAAPVFAFLLWWVFWPNPVAQLWHAFSTFGIGTNNIEVLLDGKWYCSGSTVPWYYPYWYLAITTPLIIFIPFIVGVVLAVVALFRAQKTPAILPLLLLLWLFLPLTRYVIPKVGVIDGIRHFEEVLFPIAALAAIGMEWILGRITSQKLRFVPLAAVVVMLTAINVTHHPYQIAYFNGLVGGVSGAMGKYDLDYWGTSQKAAVLWVNEHAPTNAKVHIVMNAPVAGQYLRPDLITNLNRYGYDESDFVILLNRQSFLYRFFYAYEFLLHHKPAHTISVAGAPLTWIYDNRTDNTTPRQTPWWQGEDPCIIQYWKK